MNNGWNSNFKIRNGKQPQVAPCKDCGERHPACHSDCEKFKGWKERENKAKKSLWKTIIARNTLNIRFTKGRM